MSKSNWHRDLFSLNTMKKYFTISGYKQLAPKQKKRLLICGITVVAIIVYACIPGNDGDKTNKMLYAREALTRVDHRLSSRNLNPDERDQLQQMRREIKQEIATYKKNKKNGRKNSTDKTVMLTAHLEFAQQMMMHINQELTSHGISPQERRKLILTRTKIRKEMRLLSKKMSEETNQTAAPAPTKK